MKQMNTNYKLILLIFLISLLFASEISGQAFLETKTIIKSYKTKPTTTVDITNKYGKIHFITWQKDSVKFEVKISIKTDSEAKLEKLKQIIDVDFTGTEYYVTVVTSVGGRHNNIFKDLLDFADPTAYNDNYIDIDYIVHIPDYIGLEIENKYGDVFIDNHKGSFNLELSHGKIRANKLEGTNDIQIKFGDGTINQINTAKMNIFYSDFLIKKVNSLKLESKSSDISLKDVKTLKVNTRRDKFHIDKINSLYGISTFSDFWIYNLSKETNIELKYGEVNFESIANTFSFLKIDPKYTDVTLSFEAGASYNLDMQSKNIQFNYPESIADLNQKIDPNDNKKIITEGIIGSKKSKMSKLNIEAENCTINIIHK
jgi:hypothetical protein